MNTKNNYRGQAAAVCAVVGVGSVATALFASPQAAPAQKVSRTDALQEAGAPFGKLRLVDEIDCAATPPTDPNRFVQVPANVSRVETVLGRQVRVLPNEGDTAKYFAYRIGANKGLRAGQAYVLSVEFPEDKPRALFISNRGNETSRGFATGQSLGDSLLGYTTNNNESLKLPLSGKFRTSKTLFYLHDRFPGIELPRGAGPRPELPDGGFWVVVTQPSPENDPISQGAAVARIRLFAVPNPAAFDQKLRLPPKELPRRHIFVREEMADGVISSTKPEERGVTDTINWVEYRMRQMTFLGMNTFTTDLLEFGHNQGWDAGPNNDWFVNPPAKDRWEKTLDRIGKYGLDVLPYYEYAGAVGEKGIGREKRSLMLSGGKDYTHITWSERFNADITDPDTLADAKRLLDATIVRYKGKAPFVGAWFRPRPSHMPISFGDAALARFSSETGHAAVTREQLRADEPLRQKYYTWWFGKRKAFLTALATHLRQTVDPTAVLLMTTDSSEPGRSLPAPSRIVTDDPETWKTLLSARKPGGKLFAAAPLSEVVASNAHLTALTSPQGTWGEWEWQHSDPQADPFAYQTGPGSVLLTYSMNRAYTVSNPLAFDAFRTSGGLAAVYHHPLNETQMDKSLGYFVSDVDRAGPYSVMTEVLAVANGDPRFLGYLTSNSFSKGFPEYTRAFNAAFLALPALPSTVLKNASSDPEVVVRSIPAGKNGTYLAVAHVGLLPKKSVTLTLPVAGTVKDAVTGAVLPSGRNRTLTLPMEPCQLRAFVISGR
ncbi:MAG: hypothetical protein V4671_05060 [Armatimonadota bacterium]